MLFAPGNFRGDPEGHLANQWSHFWIGYAGASILAPHWGYPAAVIVALAYGFIWEGLVQKWVLPMDSFEDSLNVASGAVFAVSGSLLVLAAWVVLLAAGVWRRS